MFVHLPVVGKTFRFSTPSQLSLAPSAAATHSPPLQGSMDGDRNDLVLQGRTSTNGRTPPSYAVERGHEPAVKLLSMQNPNNPRNQSEDLDVATNHKVEDKQNPRTEDCSHNPEAIQTGPPTDSAYASATHDKFEHTQNFRGEYPTQSSEDVQPRPPTDEGYASAANNISEDAQNPKDQASDDINSTDIPSVSSGLTLASYVSREEFVGAADEYGEGRFDHTEAMQRQVLLQDDGYISPTNLGVIREFLSESDKIQPKAQILRKLVSNASSSTVNNQETSNFTGNFHRTLEEVLSSASVNEHSSQDSPNL